MKKYRASKLIVKKLTNNEVKDFLNEYHKQGFIMSEKCYGLFDGDELLQVETFGKPRIELQSKCIWHDWELYRECSKKDTQIYGGKSKLLKAFENECHPLCLLSYCSITEGFDGHSYKACGFKLEKTTQDYWYEYNNEKIQRYRMQKNANARIKGKIEPIQKTLELYGKTYNPDLSEKENAINAGFILKKGDGQQVWTKLYSPFVGYVYKITNKTNNKFYIGQHTLYRDSILKRTNYWGSGVIIKEAISKYGKKNFEKEVLEWCKTPEILNERELFWINSLKNENCYNIATNGFDSWRNTDKELSIREKIAKTKSTRHYEAWNKGLKGTQVPWNKGMKNEYTTKPCSEERKKKISEANKGKGLGFQKSYTPWNKGKKTGSNKKYICIETKEEHSFSEWMSKGYNPCKAVSHGLHFQKIC